MTILLKNNVFLKAAIIVYSMDLPWILVRERQLFSKDTEGIYSFTAVSQEGVMERSSRVCLLLAVPVLPALQD